MIKTRLEIEAPIMVSFDQFMPAQRQEKIVSPPDQGEKIPPKQTDLSSDKDNTVIREQIQRGLPDAGNSISSETNRISLSKPQAQNENRPQESSKPATESDQPEKVQKKLSDGDLFLDQKTLSKNFKVAPPQNKAVESESKIVNRNQSYKPFSRPSGSGARFLGNYGSADYLPNLPDGDITLLNAKANQFAVFVRRVATQVFTQLRLQGWEVLRSADINSASRDTIVRAILNHKGNLIRVVAENSSGSMKFDNLVRQAAERGATDPHPPPGAISADGTIQFIFQARSWSEPFPEPRTGMMMERRWLLLGTGLE